ncbi:hypothetical protein TrVGV298_000045 [Trichoderma virens]|nr:hypothetical protein TrVGV298_000045 [Trichoderma virens]
MDFRKMLEDAAIKYPNRPFRINAFGTDYVVYPSKQFDEIKRLPESQVSSLEYLREAFHATWSGIPRHSEEMMKAVSVDLARAIPSLVHQRQQDCASSCEAAIGSCVEWKEISLYAISQKIVVSTNSSAFVGRDLGTSSAWISHVDRLPMAVAIPSIISTTSTAGTLFFLLTELADDPALVDALRDEIKTVAPGGLLPFTHLNELRKLDSVMRESARVNPFSHIILWRKVMQPLKLSIGPELPVGTNICVDAHHINFSPDLWERPEEFDGLRHYRARQKPGNEQRFKFANLGSDAPGWGDGSQACPGRLFADNTLKIILTHILMNYDFKFRPGETKPKKGSMPNGSMYPDMGAKLLFRKRNQ